MAVTQVQQASTDGMDVWRVPCLSDNYSWLLRDASGKVAMVDPAELGPVVAALEQLGLKLDYILNTHHHDDHVGANLALKEKFGCKIVGPKADEKRIPGIDVALGDGETFAVGEQKMVVFDTPGHTTGHITLFFEDAKALFPGDTLFLMGCGRMFEGTPQQFWGSLNRLKSLNPEARVYCAHEYTQSNAKFAVSVDPENPALAARKEKIDAARAAGEATVPGVLGDELTTNPFLRPDDPKIRAKLGVAADAPMDEAWAAIRKAKDNF
ncbi:unnamed protein product [Pedinophyceae sp. YPF-701]|nr:unnamed protein product [Pedinophyceae sp. YPF-701]